MYINILKDRIIEVRDELIKLGYHASIANMDCFDIEQDGDTHYLSFSEAYNLITSGLNHPVILDNHVYLRSLNRWYEFKINP